MIKKHLSGLVTALLAAALIISGCSSSAPTTAPGEASTTAAAGAAAEDTSETGSAGSAAGEETNATDGAGRTETSDDQSTAETADTAETAVQAEKTATIVTNSGRLRVRSGPGADYDIVTYLNNGDTVTVLSIDGDWAQIRTADGQEGYVSTAFLRIEEAETADTGNTAEDTPQADTAEQAEAADTGETEAEAGSAEQTGGEQTATVSTSSGRLRVRSGPGANYDIVAYLYNGDTVTVLSIDGDWAKIRTADGEEGYVSVSFLHMTEGTETAEEETEAADEGETLEEEEATEPAGEEEEETTQPAGEEEEETTESAGEEEEETTQPAGEETGTADEGSAEEVSAAASRYSVYAGTAFEELNNVRAEMNEDGSYYYEDQTGDGVTVVNSAYTGRLTYTEGADEGTTGDTAAATEAGEDEAAEDTAENADSISLVSAYLTKVLSGRGMTDISDMTVEKSETIEENIPDEAKAEAWTATWTMKADGSEKACRGAVICTETFTYVYYLSVDSDQAQDTQEKHTEIINGLTLMDGEG